MSVVTRTAAAGTAQARAARKKHLHAYTSSSNASRVVASHDDKALSLLGRSQALGSNTTTGLGAPCASFAIVGVKHCIACTVGNVYVADGCRRLVAKEHTLGTPAARIASNRRQPPAKDAEVIAACATWPKSSATSPTPTGRCLVFSAPHMPPLPEGLALHIPTIRQPGPKVCGRPESQAHGTWKSHPRRHVLRPCCPYHHLVIWTFALPCSSVPRRPGLCDPCIPHQKSPLDAESPGCWAVPTPRSRHHTPYDTRTDPSQQSLTNDEFHCSGYTSPRMPFP